ncbi:ABC transporter permease [Tissierella carlieri]|uniref:ABC transporter permease n=1 Tax=Tissierella carlieri TaxID=689904 RepID=A0ABT1S699_9FIRM|nr:ABC transporter permease [Tissierella carlieri]MCQ4922002.1 ABC transporter permease [Tissierella carlieri]
MKVKKRVLMILTLLLCLTTGLCWLIGGYIGESTANNLYMMSIDEESAFFNAKDITFLNEKKHPFTFIAKQYINISSGIIGGQAEIIGTNENFAYMKKLKILSGSFFNEIHIGKNSNVVVLSSGAAWHFFGNKQSVGNDIIIGNEKFQVVGVFEKDLAQEDEILLYMPFEKLNQLVSNELKVLDIWLQLDNISEVEPIIIDMGYLSNDIKIVEINQYKDIVMQRFKFIIFIVGIVIIIFLWKMILNNIRILKLEIIEFLKENYIRDIWSIFSNRKVLFKLLYSLTYILSALLIWKIIRFKPCMPSEFFMWRDYNFYVLRDMLDFYIQPNIGVPALQYLNHLNTVSNILFFLSILSATSILCVLFRRNLRNLVQDNDKLENKKNQSFI